jgi:hypothetical protein
LKRSVLASIALSAALAGCASTADSDVDVPATSPSNTSPSETVVPNDTLAADGSGEEESTDVAEESSCTIDSPGPVTVTVKVTPDEYWVEYEGLDVPESGFREFYIEMTTEPTGQRIGAQQIYVDGQRAYNLLGGPLGDSPAYDLDEERLQVEGTTNTNHVPIGRHFNEDVDLQVSTWTAEVSGGPDAYDEATIVTGRCTVGE